MNKYVLLDIHGVLTDGNERKLFFTQISKEYGVDPVEHNLLWIKHVGLLDKNIEKASAYIKIFNKLFKTKISEKDYFNLFRKNIVVNRELINMIHKTRNLKVCIASDNFYGLHVGFNSIFGESFKNFKKFYSYKLKSIKSEEMLSMILLKLQVSAEDCILIDDSEKNIDKAKNIGMKTVLHQANGKTLLELNNILYK